MLVMLLLVGLPLLMAVFFGIFAIRGEAPMVYHCARCQSQFHRPGRRGYPDACPRCGAADWNRSG